MPLRVYLKSPTVRQRVARTYHSPRRSHASRFAAFLVVIGSLAIGSVMGPFLAYFLVTAPLLKKDQLLSPLVAEATIPSSPTSTRQILSGQPIVYAELDYRKPENWFPTANSPVFGTINAMSYTLSIPALGMKNATVSIGGLDLSKSLVQYPGTANPGEYGSPVIFGHSVLRQFYNPKNYMTIFSTIMTLGSGDEIHIEYNGVKYTYKVVNKIVVKPTDIEILQQRYDGRFLKLITCVPEGTYLNRGVVIAELSTPS